MYLPPISQVVSAAANGLRDIAREPGTHPAHVYIGERLGVQPTLCARLRALSPAEAKKETVKAKSVRQNFPARRFALKA